MRKFNVLLLIGLLAMSGPALAADAVERVDPAQHLAQLLVEQGMATAVAEKLAGSGLAEQDIDRIALQSLNGLTRCMVAEVEKSPSPYARQWLDLLSRAPTWEELDAWERAREAQHGDEDDLRQELEACALEFGQAAGLTSDLDDAAGDR